MVEHTPWSLLRPTADIILARLKHVALTFLSSYGSLPIFYRLWQADEATAGDENLPYYEIQVSIESLIQYDQIISEIVSLKTASERPLDKVLDFIDLKSMNAKC